MFPADTDFESEVTLETANSSLADDDLPFKILFLGDWRGRRNVLIKELFDLRPIEIDRDNFDDVMRNLNVGLELKFEDSGENALTLEFNELEDFHPDRIFQRVSLFSNLREIRKNLSNPDTYNLAAREVRSWIKNDKAAVLTNSNFSEEIGSPNQTASDNLLDQILGQADEEIPVSQKSNVPSSELSAFISKLVKPHLIQTDLEEQSNLLLVVDEITSDLMRKILHHPQFQSLESAWRGAYLLVRKIETNQNLKVFILDIDKSELSEDLKSTNDLTDSRIYKILTNSAESWAMSCGNYSFGLNVDDAAVLVRLAKIGHNTNVPFVSHIQPEMFGFKSFDSVSAFDKLRVADGSTEFKLWNALRSLPESAHLGLAVPRFLARLPYGTKTEPTEAFYFEEFTQNIRHEQYVWANPAFICALLLAQSFSEAGWKLSTRLVQDFEGLSLYFYQDGTETKSKSCAEIIMIQANAEILIEQGLMPIISFRDTDRIRVGRFQSVTFSESMLSGKWS